MYFLSIKYFSFIKLLLFISLISALPVKSISQKIFNPYPFQFDQVFYYKNTINPASNLNDNNRFLQVGHNGFNQLSNNIATYYLNTRITFDKDSIYNPNKLGLFIINDKEGVYLNRFKLMGQYAYSIHLTDKTTWTSGISIGFVNNALKPNDAIGSESVYSPDGDIGTWLNHGDFYCGLSLNQFFNNKINFLNGNYLRKRHTSFLLGFNKQISRDISIKTEFFGRSGPELYNKYALGLTIGLKEYISLSLVGKSGNGLIPAIGVKNIPFLKNKMQFMFSWRIPTSKLILAGTGNTEIMIEYNF